MSLNNQGFSKNQRVSLSRLDNVYCNPFVVESLDYNYTILHGLERLDFLEDGTTVTVGDFSRADFSPDDFYV